MRLLSIWGDSDDRVIFKNVDLVTSIYYGGEQKYSKPRCLFKDGSFGAEIDTCARTSFSGRSRFLVCNKILIHSFYGLDATPVWCFAVSRIDEVDNYPDWNIAITAHESGYSMRVDIHIPDEIKEIRVDHIHLDAMILDSDKEFWEKIQKKYSKLIGKVNDLLDQDHYSENFKNSLRRIKAVFYPRNNLQQVMTRDEAHSRMSGRYPMEPKFHAEVHSAICDVEEKRRQIHVKYPVD